MNKLSESSGLASGELPKTRIASAREFRPGRGGVLLRLVSTAALGLAFSSAILLVAQRLIHCLDPDLFQWNLKSAVPLILIGVAFAALQFVLPRSRTQMLLGLAVAVAFILWGTEQFLSNQAVISLLDDVVVFLFVLDLSIVIHGHLKPGVNPVGTNLPFDEPGK